MAYEESCKIIYRVEIGKREKGKGKGERGKGKEQVKCVINFV
jgi:hypothetical protein